MFNENQINILNQELSKDRIKTRTKGNINLSYLEGFDVIETANRVFGFGDWEYSISNLNTVSSELNQNSNHIVCYKAVVKVLIHNNTHTKFITREDVGFGTGIARTLADANEGGAKEAVTDAIKRTLRSFGNQFGNSLYDKSRINGNNQKYDNNTQQKPLQQNNYREQYKHQQDFGQLTSLGLQIIQQGDSLIVKGENVFANKEIIKNSGFRWDGQSKSWYMPLRNAS